MSKSLGHAKTPNIAQLDRGRDFAERRSVRFDPNHQSNDVEDRRGQTSNVVNAGGLGLIASLLLRTKYGWILLVVGAIVYVGARALGFVGSSSDGAGAEGAKGQIAAGDTEAHFSADVLDDAQQFWETEFKREGKTYPHATLVLFTDSTSTNCGRGDAATGPFYCPNDQKVYIDLGFFRVMSAQLGAEGQFARAYVIAHEIGHHVQKLLGISDKVERGNAVGESGSSVRLELQADCFAGIWARSADARGRLERGDIESALNAAARIGDDVLQRESTGKVRPDKFTHGTSVQRLRWLKRGFENGSTNDCDTFSASTL